MKYLEYIIKMQSIAKIGLTFSTDPYAIENYKLVQELSKEMLEKYTNQTIEKENYFIRDVYPTPNISARCLVIKNNKILLVRESVTQTYSLPGGWVDYYHSVADTAIEEVKQESGFDIKVAKVLAIFNNNNYFEKPISVSETSIYFLAHIIGGKAQISHETDDVAFFDLNNLPKMSSKTTKEQFEIIMDIYNNNKETYFE
ncbi:MAG: NUDIX hydrolase N-terminal domain-containing protein [Bacilli bacterium]|jgi:8-oxo-dGTP diphosphatase|nr:NUDIX hydrolase N-terminal domain-containing protein [Bacilli bacterium]